MNGDPLHHALALAAQTHCYACCYVSLDGNLSTNTLVTYAPVTRSSTLRHSMRLYTVQAPASECCHGHAKSLNTRLMHSDAATGLDSAAGPRQACLQVMQGCHMHSRQQKRHLRSCQRTCCFRTPVSTRLAITRSLSLHGQTHAQKHPKNGDVAAEH
jgi:hypothetical protein